MVRPRTRDPRPQCVSRPPGPAYLAAGSSRGDGPRRLVRTGAPGSRTWRAASRAAAGRGPPAPASAPPLARLGSAPRAAADVGGRPARAALCPDPDSGWVRRSAGLGARARSGEAVRAAQCPTEPRGDRDNTQQAEPFTRPSRLARGFWAAAARIPPREGGASGDPAPFRRGRAAGVAPGTRDAAKATARRGRRAFPGGRGLASRGRGELLGLAGGSGAAEAHGAAWRVTTPPRSNARTHARALPCGPWRGRSHTRGARTRARAAPARAAALECGAEPREPIGAGVRKGHGAQPMAARRRDRTLSAPPQTGPGRSPAAPIWRWLLSCELGGGDQRNRWVREALPAAQGYARASPAIRAPGHADGPARRAPTPPGEPSPPCRPQPTILTRA